MHHAIGGSLVLTLAMSATALAQAQGLEGTWHLDTARSQLADQRSANRRTLKSALKIVFEGDRVLVDIFESLGRPFYWEVYDLDGKPRPMFSDLFGEPPRLRTAVWHQDRRGFDVEQLNTGNGHRMRSTWGLSPDGRTLIIEEVAEPPFAWQQMRIFVREADVPSLLPPFDFGMTPVFVDGGGPAFVFTCPNRIGGPTPVPRFVEDIAIQFDGVVYPYTGPIPQAPAGVDIRGESVRILADLRQDRTRPLPPYTGALMRLAWSIPIPDQPHTIAFRCGGEWSDLMSIYAR